MVFQRFGQERQAAAGSTVDGLGQRGSPLVQHWCQDGSTRLFARLNPNCEFLVECLPVRCEYPRFLNVTGALSEMVVLLELGMPPLHTCVLQYDAPSLLAWRLVSLETDAMSTLEHCPSTTVRALPLYTLTVEPKQTHFMRRIEKYD